MQTIDLLASIRIADTECRIPGGEISAQIEAEDPDSALVTLNQLLTALSLKEGRSYTVINHEFFCNDTDNNMVSITINLHDVAEISWVTFYYDFYDLGIDSAEEINVSEVAALWISDFFDEDNQIVIEEL
jgi:hypothetical protein